MSFFLLILAHSIEHPMMSITAGAALKSNAYTMQPRLIPKKQWLPPENEFHPA